MSAVLLCVDGALATITINRPAKLNAIDAALAGALAEAVIRIGDEPDVRVVLVRGAGRSFCAGIDRDMLADGDLPPGFFELSEHARLGWRAWTRSRWRSCTGTPSAAASSWRSPTTSALPPPTAGSPCPR